MDGEFTEQPDGDTADEKAYSRGALVMYFGEQQPEPSEV